MAYGWTESSPENYVAQASSVGTERAATTRGGLRVVVRPSEHPSVDRGGLMSSKQAKMPVACTIPIPTPCRPKTWLRDFRVAKLWRP